MRCCGGACRNHAWQAADPCVRCFRVSSDALVWTSFQIEEGSLLTEDVRPGDVMPRDVDVPDALVFFSACCALAELRLASTRGHVAAASHPCERMHADGTGSSVPYRS